MKLAQDIVSDILKRTENLSDIEYIDVLEEVASTCEDFVNVKKLELKGQTSDES